MRLFADLVVITILRYASLAKVCLFVSGLEGLFFISKARHNIKLVPSTNDITHRRKLFIYIHGKKIHSTIF